MKKLFAAGMAALLIMNSVPALASQGTQQASITYKNITVYADGQLVDTTGAEPFIYNGTTYLPVRAIANAVGKEVNWVGETNTVYLGAMPSAFVETDTLLEDMYSYNNSFSKIEHVNMGADNQSKKHESGCIFKSSNLGTVDENSVEYSLNGKYKSLKGTLAIPYVDRNNKNNKTFKIYADDEEVFSAKLDSASEPQSVDIDLSGVAVLKIELEGSGSVGLYDSVLYVK